MMLPCWVTMMGLIFRGVIPELRTEREHNPSPAGPFRSFGSRCPKRLPQPDTTALTKSPEGSFPADFERECSERVPQTAYATVSADSKMRHNCRQGICRRRWYQRSNCIKHRKLKCTSERTRSGRTSRRLTSKFFFRFLFPFGYRPLSCLQGLFSCKISQFRRSGEPHS